MKTIGTILTVLLYLSSTVVLIASLYLIDIFGIWFAIVWVFFAILWLMMLQNAAFIRKDLSSILKTLLLDE